MVTRKRAPRTKPTSGAGRKSSRVLETRFIPSPGIASNAAARTATYLYARLGPIPGRIWFKPISMVEENSPRIPFECPTLNFRCNLRSVAAERGGRRRAHGEPTPIYFKIYRVYAVLHLIRRQRRDCGAETRNPRVPPSDRNSHPMNLSMERHHSPPAYFLLNNSPLRTLGGRTHMAIHTDCATLSVLSRRVITFAYMCNLIEHIL